MVVVCAWAACVAGAALALGCWTVGRLSPPPSTFLFNITPTVAKTHVHAKLERLFVYPFAESGLKVDDADDKQNTYHHAMPCHARNALVWRGNVCAS